MKIYYDARAHFMENDMYLGLTFKNKNKYEENTFLGNFKKGDIIGWCIYSENYNEEIYTSWHKDKMDSKEEVFRYYNEIEIAQNEKDEYALIEWVLKKNEEGYYIDCREIRRKKIIK